MDTSVSTTSITDNVYEVCSSKYDLLSITPPTKMEIFLRIRPDFSSSPKNQSQNIYSLDDSSTLHVKHFFLNDGLRRSTKVTNTSESFLKKKYSFSKIFNQETNQAQFFDEAVKPLVIDFFNNQSSTISSYGTIDAGKTYTLFGSETQPGVIPRSIEFIYSSVICTLAPCYKPKRFSNVINLNEFDRNLENQKREKILSSKLVDKSACKEAYEKLKNLESSEKHEVSQNYIYSIWISFVEIYNDSIIDLLDVNEEGTNMHLKLAMDQQGVTYIQGMRSICVTTGLEAYEILNAGLAKLSTENTPTYKSSRSHSIFEIKLLKYDKDSTASEVQVSTLTFYDLAGIGRIQKVTGNYKQFSESRNINRSLLAFGRCFKTIAGDHLKQTTVPFRDSKLTRLFQRSLSRKETIILFINLNPTLALFAESQSVLSFASVAIKVRSEFEKETKRSLDVNMLPLDSKEVHSSSREKLSAREDVESITLRNEQLLRELDELKSMMLKKEYEVRQELADSYSQQIHNLEEYWKNRMSALENEKNYLLDYSIKRVENYYEGRLKECTNKKIRKTDRGDYEEFSDERQVIEQNRELLLNVSLLNQSIEELKIENRQLKMEKNQQEFDVSILKKNLKKLADISISSRNSLENIADFYSLDDKEYDTLISSDKDMASYLSIIRKYFIKSFVKEISSNDINKSTMLSQGIQCNINCTVVKDFCTEIEDLLEPKPVTLPGIDDSLNISMNTQDINFDSKASLSILKELIVEKFSKIMKINETNYEKLHELRSLRNKVENLEKENLEQKIQFQESESSRLLLSKQIEDLKNNLKSNDFFKSLEFITIEPENNLIDKSGDDLILSDHHLLSPNSTNDCHLSFTETDSDNPDTSMARSSYNSSKNDSGLASTEECSLIKDTDEKYCQTSFTQEDDRNQVFQERLLQLKLDYKQMKAQHLAESLKVTELSQELDNIKDILMRFKQNVTTKEQAIIEFQSKLNDSSIKIEQLKDEKMQLKKKCSELSSDLETMSKEYEKRLSDSEVKWKVYEEGENRASKCLENYWKKSVTLGSELSIVYTELEKNSIKCYQDHILKINELEKELTIERSTRNQLEERIIEYEKDLSRLNTLSEKVIDFECLLGRIQKEKFELYNKMKERIQDQSEIEEQFQELLVKIKHRDDEIASLKIEIGSIVTTNLSNTRKAKDLSKHVNDLVESICLIKKDIAQSKETQKNLVRNSNKEIDNLRARLTVFEENSEVLNLFSDSKERYNDEVEKLKHKFLQKEKELEIFKENRNTTIQRYESLVRQLQETLKMNQQSSKFRKLFYHKQKYVLGNAKEMINSDIDVSEPKIRDWKVFKDDEMNPRLQTVVSPCTVDSGMTPYKEEPI